MHGEDNIYPYQKSINVIWTPLTQFTYETPSQELAPGILPYRAF